MKVCFFYVEQFNCRIRKEAKEDAQDQFVNCKISIIFGSFFKSINKAARAGICRMQI